MSLYLEIEFEKKQECVKQAKKEYNIATRQYRERASRLEDATALVEKGEMTFEELTIIREDTQRYSEMQICRYIEWRECVKDRELVRTWLSQI